MLQSPLAALYTFCITISAGVHLIRDRRHQDPIVNAANILSLTAALVSILALQTAMLTQFGDGSLSPSQMKMPSAEPPSVSVSLGWRCC